MVMGILTSAVALAGMTLGIRVLHLGLWAVPSAWTAAWLGAKRDHDGAFERRRLGTPPARRMTDARMRLRTSLHCCSRPPPQRVGADGVARGCEATTRCCARHPRRLSSCATCRCSRAATRSTCTKASSRARSSTCARVTVSRRRQGLRFIGRPHFSIVKIVVRIPRSITWPRMTAKRPHAAAATIAALRHHEAGHRAGRRRRGRAAERSAHCGDARSVSNTSARCARRSADGTRGDRPRARWRTTG